MICRNCGNEIPDNSMFCLHCGCELSTDSELFEMEKPESANTVIDLNNKETKQKKTIKRFGLIIATLLTILVIFISCILLNNPAQKYVSLIKKGDTTKASELYDSKIANNSKRTEKIKEELSSDISDIYDNYYSEKITYDEAIKEIKKYDNAEVVSTDYHNIYKKINSLYTSRYAFEKAKEAEKKNDVKTAISKYKLVIQDDKNYEEANNKVEELTTKYRNDKLSEAAALVENGKFSEAITALNELKNVIGSDEEISSLIEEYTEKKNEEYVAVKLTDKGILPKNYDSYRYFDSVSFVFTVTNNTTKDIKGVEGTAVFYDLFGNKIISIGTDFLGKTIKPGQTATYEDLIYEVIPTYSNKDATKLLNTDYSDLKFEYKVETIVFTDGTSIKPD